MSDFSDGIDEAFGDAVEEMGDTVTIGGMEVPAVITALEQGASLHAGGRLAENDVEIFIKRTDWEAAGGRRGCEITLPGGAAVRVKKTVSYGGSRLALTCGYAGVTAPK
jgi:hypothetical protein